MNIKKGDNVVVIAGKDKKKSGKVTSTFPKEGKVVVENINIITKHKKPRSAQDKGGIIKLACPMQASNVMILCPSCGKATRVAHQEIEGKKARVCKKCGLSLDKDVAKAVKKAAKAATKKETTEKTADKKATGAKKPAAKKTVKAETSAQAETPASAE